MFSSFLLSTLFGVACSTPVFKIPTNEISPTSEMGQNLLAQARRLDNGDDDNAEDFSWMSGYTMKFEHCVANANCGNNGCESLVHFSLCPNGNCTSGCSGGAEYVVDMYYFLNAFTEAQLEAKEYACEMAREDCGDDDGCYAQYGLDDCDEEEGNFNLQKYIECNQFGDDGYYIGPYCSSDSTSIYLGFFSDNTCTTQASENTFYNLYGYDLEYSDYSIVEDSCAYCQEHGEEEHQNEGDQEDEDDVLEQCENLYTYASGCEEDIDVDNPDTDACDYIKNTFSYANAGDNTQKSNTRRAGRIFGKLVMFLLIIGASILACCCCFAKKDGSSRRAPLLASGPGIA